MTGINTNDQTGTSVYQLEVLHDNTPSLATPHSIGKLVNLHTASTSAACGLHLQKYAIYLMKGPLSGNEATNLHVHMCNTYAKILHKAPTETEAKQMFAELYKAEC